jgi:hypothetical protein
MMGKIDDLRIYNKALSSTDIDQLYRECTDNVTITSEPESIEVLPGGSATFSVGAEGSKVNYLWQIEKNNAFVSVPNNCQFVTNLNKLSIDPVGANLMGARFRVIAYNCTNRDTSEIFEIIEDKEVIYDTIRVNDTTVVYDTTHVTIYDTTVIKILETHHIEVYDTTYVVVTDTAFVTIYDTVYTSVTDTLIIDAALTAGPNPTRNTLKVYPNPARDRLFIDNGNYSLMNYYSIEVFNVKGQRVFHDFIDHQKMEIDLSTWGGSGLYVLMLNDKNNKTIEVRKIVIQ